MIKRLVLAGLALFVIGTVAAIAVGPVQAWGDGTGRICVDGRDQTVTQAQWDHIFKYKHPGITEGPCQTTTTVSTLPPTTVTELTTPTTAAPPTTPTTVPAADVPAPTTTASSPVTPASTTSVATPAPAAPPTSAPKAPTPPRSTLPATGRDLTAFVVIALIMLFVGLLCYGPQIYALLQRRRK